MTDFRHEIDALKKDLHGLIELNGELKDEVMELREENEELKKHVTATFKEVIPNKTKGISANARKLLDKLAVRVEKLENEFLVKQLDHNYIESMQSAFRDLACEFRQTVAANDSH